MSLLDIAGTVVGLIYLWLELKASRMLWIVGVIMPAIYIFLYWQAGLYADFGINVYYLCAAVYGFIVWTRGTSRDDAAKSALRITRTPLRLLLPMALTFVAALLLIAAILLRYTDSTVPWADSFTTALSIIGMWMLTRKYLEQWLAWIAVDAVSCVLYVYKEIPFTAALYGIYAVIALFGYIRWKKMMFETF
jgi:nicotinamide mononucleotide transporter